MTKRVWILGAGFSRPLGGPLLPDVMSVRSWHRLRARWPDVFGWQKMSPGLNQVYRIFHFGRGFPEATFGSGTGERLFTNAEDFLLRLDRAHEGGDLRYLKDLVSRVRDTADYWYPAADKYKEVAMEATSNLLMAATRIMAAECELFVDGVNPERESAWLPYLKWAQALTKDDTIVTFNYDRVVETLLKDRPLKTSCIGTNSALETTTLCKMHGSVDWSWDGEKLVQAEPDITSPHYAPAIGIPGSAKDTMADKEFLESWANANWALERANEVHIVGYSLPESDAKSRDWLLRGLKANGTRDLVISLTLGEPSFATRRLKAMLTTALSHRRPPEAPRGKGLSRLEHQLSPTLDIQENEMWAQDLLDAHATKGEPGLQVV